MSDRSWSGSDDDARRASDEGEGEGSEGEEGEEAWKRMRSRPNDVTRRMQAKLTSYPSFASALTNHGIRLARRRSSPDACTIAPEYSAPSRRVHTLSLLDAGDKRWDAIVRACIDEGYCMVSYDCSSTLGRHACVFYLSPDREREMVLWDGNGAAWTGAFFLRRCWFPRRRGGVGGD